MQRGNMLINGQKIGLGEIVIYDRRNWSEQKNKTSIWQRCQLIYNQCKSGCNQIVILGPPLRKKGLLEFKEK